jgi:DNA repair exonuclease SbcCD ATPase subunit
VILRRIAAKSFMRYQTLELADLPETGAVAIVGENESGKTTIGECIAFGLFGETVKSRATDVSQVVSWDADEAFVALDFDARGRRWRIARRVDKRGLHEARLERDGALAAEGPEAVLAAVRDLAGVSFDEFRTSFYLAQDEIALGQRAEGDRDPRAALAEITGTAALERAAAAVEREVAELRERADGLAREHAVARALMDAHALPEGFGADLDAERAELEATSAAAREELPALEQRAAALRDAIAARAAAASTFDRLECALLARRADLATRAAKEELAALAKGLAAETEGLARELENRERRAQDMRSRVDRLIEYQAKMAELEARLDLYRLEVKRALDAPTIEAEDVAALEGLALPTTPAAGAKLSEARVTRLRRSRNRALARAIAFIVLAGALAFLGIPALRHAWPDAPGAGARTQVDSWLERVIVRYAEPDSPREKGIWLALTLAGCGGGFLFLVLSVLQFRHFRSRAESLALASEARERLLGEVRALEAEREKLERLDIRKPLRFADAVKELRNPTLREAFDKLRETHNDFMQSPAQRDELVAKERQEESALRAEARELEARHARLTRLARRLPAVAAEDATAPAEIPARLEALEARAEALLETLDTADRDRREVARRVEQGAELPTPVALFQDLLGAIERVFEAAASDSAKSGGDVWKRRSVLPELIASTGTNEPAELRARLAEQRDLFERLLPASGALAVELDEAQAERRRAEASLARSEARLAGMAHQVADLGARRGRAAEHAAKADALEADLVPTRRAIEVRELAATLLRETADDVRRRVGPMLARYAAAVLPRLTGGRYRKVKVSPDLDVRVYSPEKNDYVPLVDLSLGAADQLLISLRLAIGRAVVSAKGLDQDRHFLFLDEPLASFDAARAQAFLEVLAEHRDRFPQAFVVTHARIPGLEAAFASMIAPSLAERALRASAGEAAAPAPEPSEAKTPA